MVYIKNWRFESMGIRWGFIIKNLQSSREKDFNAKHAERTVKLKRFTLINKLYYLKSFRVTLKHCREKKQLNCILRFPLLFKMEFQVLKKVFLSLIHEQYLLVCWNKRQDRTYVLQRPLITVAWNIFGWDTIRAWVIKTKF